VNASSVLAPLDSSARSGQTPVEDASVLDRGNPAVHSVRSVQSRVAQVFAIGLVTVVVGSLLGWYSWHAAHRPATQRAHAQAASEQQAKGEMVLPALGSLASLRRASRAPIEPAADPMPIAATSATGVPGMQVLRPSTPDVAPAPVMAQPVLKPSGGPGSRPAHPLARALTGPVFSDGHDANAAATTVATPVRAVPGAVDARVLSDVPSAGSGTAGKAWPASSMDAILPRGNVVDCTLETAIDSTLPGMTTCLTAVDVFGADGQRVLLPRGTQLVGETRGGVRAGQARIQVIWHSARRPDAVHVELESPGTDALGRAGLPGEIDRQFADRFGAAVLLSVIDGAIAAGVASRQRGGSSVVVTPGGSEAVMTEMLKETQGVAPKLVVAQGDRVAVLVARDLDFTNVTH